MSDGTKQPKISGQFLENKEIEIGNSLTGLIRSEFPITIQIPKYSEWHKYAEKVSLNVAIVKKSIKKPISVKYHGTIASDTRKLTYKP